MKTEISDPPFFYFLGDGQTALEAVTFLQQFQFFEVLERRAKIKNRGGFQFPVKKKLGLWSLQWKNHVLKIKRIRSLKKAQRF